MTHYAFAPRAARDRALELEADYVVVGSGAGGAAAAVTLARGGASVAIVEAGPWRDPGDYPTSIYGAMRDTMEGWGTTFAVDRAVWPIVQGALVGGTTVINSAIVVRTPGDIFREWRRDHGVGGDGLAERVWAAQDVIERDLHVTPVPRSAYGRSNALAEVGAKAIGVHDHHMSRNVEGCVGAGACLQGCRADRKRSTNLNYVPETLARGGMVLSSAPVERVLMRGKRATGVVGRFVHPRTRARGERFVVRARRAVVVACSATRSPLLLARSGIRSRALGRGFRAHPGTGVFGVYPEAVDMNTGATQGWSSMALRDDPGLKLEVLSLPPELVASRLAGAGRRLIDKLGDFRRMAMWVMAVRARAVGRVTGGPFGQPIVRYGLNRADMVALRAGAHVVARMHFAAGATAIVPGIVGVPGRLLPDEVDAILSASLDPRAWTAILSHLFGGCVAGVDPRRSVCDPDGRVHGRDNLYVLDASLLPSTLGVNPQHTIMGLAMTHAQRALER